MGKKEVDNENSLNAMYLYLFIFDGMRRVIGYLSLSAWRESKKKDTEKT